jgi:hypothetical protein
MKDFTDRYIHKKNKKKPYIFAVCSIAKIVKKISSSLLQMCFFILSKIMQERLSNYINTRVIGAQTLISIYVLNGSSDPNFINLIIFL